MRSQIINTGAGALLLSMIIGCGGDDLNLAEVEGQVTLDGKPVPNATITYTPQAPDGSPSSGVSDAEGYYTLMFSRDREGVLVGTHDVVVSAEKIGNSDAAAMRESGKEVPEFVSVPSKYSTKGELVQEVEEGSNTINLELTSG